MELTDSAKKELKEVLEKSIGRKASERFSDEDLNNFGVRLLSLTSVLLKNKIKDF